MRYYDLYKTLRHHRNLAEKRALNSSQNKAAKIMIFIMTAMITIYLVGFAIMIAMIANESKSHTAIEILMVITPYLLFFDFLIRFTAQQTPSQIIKPYVLMPIPKYACTDMFIITSLLSWGNLTWFLFFIPYCLMSVLFSYGIITTLGILILFWLLITANSQWYSIARTLITDSLLWWLLPLGVYALIATPLYLGTNCGFEHYADLWAKIGTMVEKSSPLPYLITISLLVLLTFINRKLQYVHIMIELARTTQTKLKSVSEFRFLEKYGQIGEYLKLEIKTVMRNKNPRKGFIFASAIVLLFSILISFTDIYNDKFFTNFWCLYNFVIYGAMSLTKIMCNEGNYIDALMVRKENILSLFHAKYIFYSAILFLPFILMLPTVFSGKWTLLMLVSYGIFTAGFQYFMVFQLAVYNKTTIPLNTKFISKSGVENNNFQIVISFSTFILPMAIVSLLEAFFEPTIAYISMMCIGIIFIATNRIWMRNVYKRLMSRRYENMESFRASR